MDQNERFYGSRAEKSAQEVNDFLRNLSAWTNDLRTNYEPNSRERTQTFQEFTQSKMSRKYKNARSDYPSHERNHGDCVRPTAVKHPSTLNSDTRDPALLYSSKPKLEESHPAFDKDFIDLLKNLQLAADKRYEPHLEDDSPEVDALKSEPTIDSNKSDIVEFSKPPVEVKTPVDLNEKEVVQGKLLAQEQKQLGNAAFKCGNYSSAISYYSKAIKCDPEDPILYGNRAQAYIFLGLNVKAISDCDIALIFDPTYIKAIFRRAVARIQNGDMEGGRTDLILTTKLDPNNKEAKKMLTNLNIKIQSSKGKRRVENNYDKPPPYPPLEPPPPYLPYGPVTQVVNNNLKTDNNQQKSFPKEIEQRKEIGFPRVILPIEKPPNLQSKVSKFPLGFMITKEEIRSMEAIHMKPVKFSKRFPQMSIP